MGTKKKKMGGEHKSNILYSILGANENNWGSHLGGGGFYLEVKVFVVEFFLNGNER